MEKIKVAVAGLGFIGPAHIEALRRLPNIDVVAIADVGEEHTRQKAEQLGIGASYGDFGELLKHDGVQCVHICTPNFLHFDMAKAALEAGKHVVVEKPLATTSQQGEELVALAEKTGLVNAIHFNLRYYPLVRQMRAMREHDELGDIYSVIGTYLQDWLYYDTDYNWRLEPEQSGDSRAIADIGSHLLDLVEYIAGVKIVEVLADFSTVHAQRKKPLKPVETYGGMTLKPEDYQDVPITTEDHANVLLRFDNGNKGVATVSQVSAGRKNQLKLRNIGIQRNGGLELGSAQRGVDWQARHPQRLAAARPGSGA